MPYLNHSYTSLLMQSVFG